MRIAFLLLFFYPWMLCAQKPGLGYTPSYPELIAGYQELDSTYKEGNLIETGRSDGGFPLYNFIISKDGFTQPPIHTERLVIMINNGIHPGEPDGINASLQLAKKILGNQDVYNTWLEKMIICIIPAYNPDGVQNRSCCSRVNQNGPEQYGFRANARNLDLNRDFIKNDSENARVFSCMFSRWNPHILIDTHVSNGADYPYVFTYILSQKDQITPALQPVYDLFTNNLPAEMAIYNHPVIPYVYTKSHTPDKGLLAFIDTPRFATGYASLKHCFGITIETHMLKNFDRRVQATLDGLLSILKISFLNHRQIAASKINSMQYAARSKSFGSNYENDTTRFTTFPFRGYQYNYAVSRVTGLPQLYYDTTRPVEWNIPYYENCLPTDTLYKPTLYIIPQAWHDVTQRLLNNQVPLRFLTQDTSLQAGMYYIDSVSHAGQPYEGHYYHGYVKLHTVVCDMQFNKGDIVIPMGNPTDRFVMEVLEPLARDSYFRWNFFDAILQQKEWFSDYVFDQKAEEWLKNNPHIKEELETCKKKNAVLASSTWMQLNFVYVRSPWFEPGYNRYPVARIE